MNRGRGTARGQAAAGGGASGSSRPAASATPTAAAGATRGAPLAARGTRATRAPPVARFRPKNIRRSEAERERIAKEEDKKARERAMDERRSQGIFKRGRSRRSRGDAMGFRGRGQMSGVANGPFSSGIAGPSGSSSFGRGIGGGGGGGFRMTGSRSTKSENGGFNQTVARYREARINADKLHSNVPEEELDSGDEAMISALNSRPNSLMPMGIRRTIHKEAEIVVATTAELEAAENATGETSLWVDGDVAREQSDPEQLTEEGVWDTGSKAVPIKKEDPDDQDAAMEEIEPKLGSSPEEKKKPMVEIKVQKTAPLDPEETLIQSDLKLLANELGAVSISGEDGETKTGDTANKDGRLYLFQFPPLLPPLRKTADPQPQPKVKVKDEDKDTDMLNATPAAEAVDLTAEQATDEKANEADDIPDDEAFDPSMLPEGGMIGELKVRKSGKVELDWGGRTLEVSPATAMNFLTTAVIVEEDDTKPTPDVVGGHSVGMGKIMGRFILAPIWGEEDDWDVSAEDLVIDEGMEESWKSHGGMEGHEVMEES